MTAVEASRLDAFQLVELLDFSPDRGIIRLHEQRMIVQGAAAMGLLRRELIQTLGVETARRLLLRFGYADGYHDAVSLQEQLGWQTPLDGVKAGLKLHTLEGIVHAESERLDYDAHTGTFQGLLRWRESYEAEQHLYHFGRSAAPVCWTLVGYTSGFASACLGRDVYFREKHCAGQGEASCALVGRDAAGWGDELAALHADFRGADLRADVESLRQAVARQKEALIGQHLVLEPGPDEALADDALRYAGDRHFIVRSRAMRDVLEMSLRVAPLDTTILVIGESGTGKEFIARMIHERSPRGARPLVTVNCGALTETLLESELFGHVKGAFTGASRDKTGLFEQASRSTLFLDEVGETTPALQVKLLRALQEREIRKVGADRPTRIDVRVVAATNRDLRREVAAGRFREDLYFRLAGFVVRVPPLRERREEIPVLAYEVLRRVAAKLGKESSAISAPAMSQLVGYGWPGNVRELEHAMERAAILARGPTVTVRDLPPEIHEGPSAGEGSGFNVKANEARLIRQALAAFGGNRQRAAAALGIGVVSLWRKVKQYGLDPDASG